MIDVNKLPDSHKEMLINLLRMTYLMYDKYNTPCKSYYRVEYYEDQIEVLFKDNNYILFDFDKISQELEITKGSLTQVIHYMTIDYYNLYSILPETILNGVFPLDRDTEAKFIKSMKSHIPQYFKPIKSSYVYEGAVLFETDNMAVISIQSNHEPLRGEYRINANYTHSIVIEYYDKEVGEFNSYCFDKAETDKLYDIFNIHSEQDALNYSIDDLLEKIEDEEFDSQIKNNL